MEAEELIELLAERPFVPLRLHLSNGRTRENSASRNGEMAIVGQGVIAIGVADNGERLPRIPLVSINHVHEIESVPLGS